MAHRSLAKQIRSISLNLTFGLILLTLISMFATSYIRSEFQAYQEKSEASLQLTDLFVRMIEVQKSASDWRGQPIAANADLLAQELAMLSEQVDDLSKDPALQTVYRSQIDNLVRQLEVYSAAIDRVQVLEIEFAQLDDDLAALFEQSRKHLGATLRQALTDRETSAVYFAGRVRDTLLLSHLEVEKYMHAADAKIGRAADINIKDTKTRIEDLLNAITGQKSTAHAEKLRVSFAGYQAKSDAIRKILEKIHLEEDTQDQAAQNLVLASSVMTQDIKTNQAAITASSNAASLAALLLVAVVSVVTILCGHWFTRRRARSISAQIDGAVETMALIANGDLDAEVSGANLNNEIGEVARALEIFKTNGKASIATAEREKQAQAEAHAKEVERDLRDKQQSQDAARAAETARQRTIQDLSESVGSVVNAAAQGDFSRRIDTQTQGNEFVDLSTSVNQLMDNVQTGLQETSRILSLLSGGDLTHRMEGKYGGIFADLQTDINGTIETLCDMVSRITSQCDEVSGRAGNMNEGASNLSTRVEKQASSLQQLSATMEEMAAAARSGEKGAEELKEIANASLSDVLQAGHSMESASSSMEDIQAASENISAIVDLIDGIAFQTNLLSLNASVEAARAGKAGKGFAVVASEVRGLAQRSSDASREISTLIERNGTKIQAGVEKVKGTEVLLETVVNNVKDMTQRIDGMEESGKEQSVAVQEVSRALNEIERNTQSNAKLSQDSLSDAGTVMQQSDMMREMMMAFKLDAAQDAVVANSAKYYS